jgi:hypothetical protein
MKSEQSNRSDDIQKEPPHIPASRLHDPKQSPLGCKIYTMPGKTINYGHYFITTELILKYIPFTTVCHDSSLARE